MIDFPRQPKNVILEKIILDDGLEHRVFCLSTERKRTTITPATWITHDLVYYENKLVKVTYKHTSTSCTLLHTTEIANPVYIPEYDDYLNRTKHETSESID